MKIQLTFLILMTLINLSACHTTGNVVPRTGPSMEQVYDSMQHSSILKKRRPVKNTAQEEERTVLNQVSVSHTTNAFSKTINPELKIYIYPHLSGTEEVPIPGYTTVFNAYERDHYTLVNG